MKIKKRITTILLVAMALLALVSVSALVVFAAEPEAEVTEVGSWTELYEAVKAGKTSIKLTGDIEDIVPDDELPSKHRLVFNGGGKYLLDLNGYELEVINHINEFYTGGFSMIEVSGDSQLEILNGSLVFDNYSAKADRQSRGNVAVLDNAVFTARGVNMTNAYTGTVVYAGADAEVTIDGGEYTVQNGFALYLENNASLTIDGGAYIHTVMGDSASTQYVDGYGALYSESEGTLTLNHAFFKSGVQVSPSQIGEFSVATHEVTVNGQLLTEDIFHGTNMAAKEQNKDYYWYTYTGCSLYKTENALFANTVQVISYEKKYPITVESGIAMVDGVPVTEAGYGTEITVVAHTPEEGMEFVRWSSGKAVFANSFSQSTTFKMPPSATTVEAVYGREKLKSVSINVGEIIPGQMAYAAEITPDGGVYLQSFEWRRESYLMDEYDVFQAGRTYSLTILVYPPEGQTFDDSLTATVNGKTATVTAYSQYAYVEYTFEPTPSAGFVVIYDTNASQLGIGGKIVLDTALMADQSAEFGAALDADKVSYQWYRNGEAVEGANASVYNLTAEDAGCRFYAVVTADGKTNYGHNVNCGSAIYRLDLNAGEIIAGEAAPQITPATPGISIDPESLSITEILGENTYGPILGVQNAILIPGKSYRLFGRFVEMDGTYVGYGSSVYVNGELTKETTDGTSRFFYDFTVPEADYPVYYKTNGAVGIGVTLTVDVERMCQESTGFKHAVDIQTENPTYQTVFYQWYKNGEAIADETGISYTVTTADRDSNIHCKVTLVDGKFGIGEQHIITNEITVFTLKLPVPKNGENTIKRDVITVDGATVSGSMWWPKETGATMSATDTYAEGTVYEFYFVLSPAGGFTFADAERRTVYIYGTEAQHQTGYAYMTEVTAIHKHLYDDSFGAHDEDKHWKLCVLPGCPCPDEEKDITYELHWSTTATCTEKGKCGDCDYEFYGEHDFGGGYVYQDDMTCAIQCQREGCTVLSGDWSYHEGGEADCQNKAVCDICHHEYGELAEHKGGSATCTKLAECETCGEEYGQLLSHDYSTVNGYIEADGHANTCSCGAHDTPVTHTPDRAEATETEPVKCTSCGYELKPATGHIVHTPKAEWTSDADNHWHECMGCTGQQLDLAAHTDADLDGKCDTCGADVPLPEDPENPENPEAPENPEDPENPENPEQPEKPEEPKKGLGAGAIIGIVIGSVAVVGIGGFAIFWFVIKKKSFADLLAVFKKQ